MNKQTRSNLNICRKVIASLLTIILTIGIVPSFAHSVKASVPQGAKMLEDVFFDVSQSNNTFSNNVYENVLLKDDDGHRLLVMDSSTDGRIDPRDDVFQIDYDAAITSNSITQPDGAYTIVGFGGIKDISRLGQQTITFKLKAVDPDVAKYFSVIFYSDDSVYMEYNFDEWMTTSGFTNTTISSDSFRDYELNIPAGKDASQIEGMKLAFNRANKSGTMYIDSINFGDNIIFENFYGSAGVVNERGNP